MVSGRKPDESRRRQVLQLRAKGLSSTDIARQLGCSRQNVAVMLKTLEGPRSVPCSRCGQTIVSPGALLRDAGRALCRVCLDKDPSAPFGQRLLALRLAAGLRVSDLARLSGIDGEILSACELHGRLPSPQIQARLAAILGASLVEAPDLEGFKESVTWTEEETKRLGMASDPEIARQLGRTEPAVRQKRTSLGILSARERRMQERQR